MTKKLLFVLYFLSTFFGLNIAHAQSNIELHREIWESEYSSFRGTVSNLEINKYRGEDALIGLEKIQFDEQKNQINSTRYIYEYPASESRKLQKISTWVEQFDKNNRLISKIWKFAKDDSETQDPFGFLISASNEYSIKITYLKNSLVPNKIDFFDLKYGKVAIDSVSSFKNRISITRKSIVKLYTNDDFKFYSTKQIDFDKSGRRVLEVFPSAKWEYLYSETGQLNSVTLFLIGSKPNVYQLQAIHLYDSSSLLKSQKSYVLAPAVVPKGCKIKEENVHSGYDYSYNLDDRKNWINRLEYRYGCFGGSISEKLARKITYKK